MKTRKGEAEFIHWDVNELAMVTDNVRAIGTHKWLVEKGMETDQNLNKEESVLSSWLLSERNKPHILPCFL